MPFDVATNWGLNQNTGVELRVGRLGLDPPSSGIEAGNAVRERLDLGREEVGHNIGQPRQF